MQWQPHHYLTLVRASGVYDLLVTSAFVTPWTFAWVHGGLSWSHAALKLPGDVATFAPEHVLLANLLGSVVCVWAWLRIRSPARRLGRYDAVARSLFALWQLLAVLQGASPLLLGFTVFEVIWGLSQAWPVAQDAQVRERVIGTGKRYGPA